MALVIRLLGGLTLWAAGFSMIYALHGLGCAWGWGERGFGPVTQLGAALIASWIVLVAAAIAFLLWARSRRQDDFLDRLAMIGAWAGLAGVVFMNGPVLLPAHCL